MAKHLAAPRTTQGAHPWRAVTRTLFAAVVAFASMAPFIFEAITDADAAAAGGWAGSALAIAGAITRVLALPVVDDFLERFVPFLSASVADPADFETE